MALHFHFSENVSNACSILFARNPPPPISFVSYNAKRGPISYLLYEPLILCYKSIIIGYRIQYVFVFENKNMIKT